VEGAISRTPILTARVSGPRRGAPASRTIRVGLRRCPRRGPAPPDDGRSGDEPGFRPVRLRHAEGLHVELEDRLLLLTLAVILLADAQDRADGLRVEAFSTRCWM